MTISLPPTLQSLLEVPEYETYFHRNTKLPKSISTAPAWQVMAHTHEGKWKRALRSSFADAASLSDKLIGQDDVYRDVAIISRRRAFKMPALAPLVMEPGTEWCGRCRRPTIFHLYGSRHPALSHVPVIVEDVLRCYFCGAQEGIAQPWLAKK